MNKKIKFVLMFLLLVLMGYSKFVFADSQGPNSPTQANGYWTSPGNVVSSNDQRANYDNDYQEPLYAYNFGFSISSEATITGVKVEVEGYGSESSAQDRMIDVALSDGSGDEDSRPPYGDWKTGTLPQGSGAEAYIALGSDTDLWGNGSLTYTFINASSFGIIVIDHDTQASNLNLDHIRVTVYYTVGGGEEAPTGKIIVIEGD